MKPRSEGPGVIYIYYDYKRDEIYLRHGDFYEGVLFSSIRIGTL